VPIVAKRVREYREAAKLTQAALAARVGVSREYVARLEGKGGRPQDMRLSVAARVAKALGVKVDDLLK
jgi:transcriptional regulator with XRE-family HTH domain